MRGSNPRGPWYLFSLINPLVLVLGIRGFFGAAAQEESESALTDWSNAVKSPLGQVLLMAAAIVVVAAIVVLVYTRP